MTDNGIFALMDQHLAAEYDIADASDLEDLENEVRVLSGKVDTQADQIAELNNYCKELFSALQEVASRQGFSFKEESDDAPACVTPLEAVGQS